MTTICPPLDVSSLPYARRQLVIVQPDQVVAAAREAEANAASESGDTDWLEVAGRVAKMLFGMKTICGMALELATEALKAWAKARESGLDVLQIGHSEASGLQFPPGHPREQTMYVAHPAVPTVYYTAAAFHRMAFEHKFSEAVRLLMSLGADSHRRGACAWMVERVFRERLRGVASGRGKLVWRNERISLFEAPL